MHKGGRAACINGKSAGIPCGDKHSFNRTESFPADPVFVNGNSAGEYAYPANRLTDPETKEAKARVSTELDNLVDAGRPLPDRPDGESGHTHPDAVGGFSYLETIFKVGNDYYRGIVNIVNNRRGRLLKDVTKIENITEDTYVSYGKNPKYVFLRDVSMVTMAQDLEKSSGELKKVSGKEIGQDRPDRPDRSDGGVRYSVAPVTDGARRAYYKIPFAEGLKRVVDPAQKENRDPVYVRDTPKVFRDIGFASLPMMMNARHLRLNYYTAEEFKKLFGSMHQGEHAHGLHDMLKSLPNALEHPLAIVVNQAEQAKPGSVVAITDMDVKGKKIVVPVLIEATSTADNDRIDSHLVLTVYDESDWMGKFLKPALEAEKNGVGIFYFDKEKASRYSARSKVTGSIPTGLVHNINDDGSPVKGLFKKNTETLQFKRWFRDSKVVDKNGDPLVVYHGTRGIFFVFDGALSGSNLDFGTMGKGFYFTTDRENAENIARNNTSSNGEPVVMECFLSIKNPKELSWNEISGADQREAEKLTEKWKGKGYDGFVAEAPNGATWWVAFSPTQIKSATGNIGTYDPKNPDIHYSLKRHRQVNPIREPGAIQAEHAERIGEFYETRSNAEVNRQAERRIKAMGGFDGTIRMMLEGDFAAGSDVSQERYFFKITGRLCNIYRWFFVSMSKTRFPLASNENHPTERNIIMKNQTAITSAMAALLALPLFAAPPSRPVNPDAKLHRFSSTVEKERPELDEETKRLIAEYRRNPTAANRAALRRQVEKRYDAVVARKMAKLEELKHSARDKSKVEEMQLIVDEMLRDREKRIEQTMARFADPRLRPDARKTTDGFLPVIGGPKNLSIAYTPVTNEEYAAFIKATGRKPPKDWKNGTFPAGKGQHPVVNVSCEDANAYCRWLTQKDGKAKYRLPTAEEWEIAAGHMPKDADFNCGEHDGTTPVTQYAKTLSACGAVDMWGNVWEWTSSVITAQTGAEKGKKVNAVKGGSWNSHRTSCRTESREEGRVPNLSYNTVGFRIVREK